MLRNSFELEKNSAEQNQNTFLMDVQNQILNKTKSYFWLYCSNSKVFFQSSLTVNEKRPFSCARKVFGMTLYTLDFLSPDNPRG